MSKIKFTYEDMRKTFMHVDVVMSEPSFWWNDEYPGEAYGCSAKVEVRFNGALIWEAELIDDYSSARYCDEISRDMGEDGGAMINYDDVVEEVYDENDDYLGVIVDFKLYDFDPEVAMLVCKLMVRHENEFRNSMRQHTKEFLSQMAEAT